ncbi:hypothetical protein BMS3Bbin12_01259 [bacterium BMS3Bbin12]|jgi:hypothetical protein|nr:hypothetical protein BMS3Abin12_01136 [bacterium BMS3Abin12]GBE48084.1 hypothetical protein BMS3Bbin12_01259 [bacterium BMS3Bbin12]GBE50081.1 hypothetical protein BMS3Bbin13_01006 [bacterium BMS3Bbin13]HDJ85481.1 hypothetical protein [Chromatiales bacterium]HDK02226.1 hypothetical protein [Gammaproteobacteria bacterium]
MDHNHRHYGPRIGNYLGKPIFEKIEDREGTYVFDRIAQCDVEGCPLDQLDRGEMLIPPGLIYRQV